MRRVFTAAAVVTVASGCAQLLGVDDVVYLGDASALDASDGAVDAGADGIVFDAPADVTIVCDADTQASDTNCGRCGHACGNGSACNAGICSAVVVVSALNLAAALATDGVRVFYRDAKTITGCLVGGCDGGEPLAQTATVGPTSIAAGATSVYWMDGTQISSCTKTACSASKLVIDATPRDVAGVGVSATNVYASSASSLDIALFRSGLDGTGAASIESLTNATNTGAVAPRPGGGVYWYEIAPTAQAMYCDTTCASGATATRTLAATPSGIVATSSAVFIATPSGIVRADDALASPPAPFYSSGAGISSIAANASTVFFVESLTVQRIGACSVASSACPSPTWLYTSPTSSYPLAALAADATYVYWVEKGGEQIKRMSP